MQLSRLRVGGFIVLCTLSATVATVYVVHSARRGGPADLTILAPPKPSLVQHASESTAGSDAARTPDDRERKPPSGSGRTRLEPVARPETAPRATKAEEAPSAAGREAAYLAFRSTALGSTYGSLAVAPLDALYGPLTITTLRCNRQRSVERIERRDGEGAVCASQRRASEREVGGFATGRRGGLLGL